MLSYCSQESYRELRFNGKYTLEVYIDKVYLLRGASVAIWQKDFRNLERKFQKTGSRFSNSSTPEFQVELIIGNWQTCRVRALIRSYHIRNTRWIVRGSRVGMIILYVSYI